jgi:hypothetical protein
MCSVQGISFFSYVGPLIQSCVEAKGAVVPVFRFIDEVYFTYQCIELTVLSAYHICSSKGEI